MSTYVLKICDLPSSVAGSPIYFRPLVCCFQLVLLLSNKGADINHLLELQGIVSVKKVHVDVDLATR